MRMPRVMWAVMLLAACGGKPHSESVEVTNPLLSRCVMNAVVIMDPAGNRKLDKSKSTGRIDGAVALAMALGLKAQDRPEEKPQVWDAWSDPTFVL